MASEKLYRNTLKVKFLPRWQSFLVFRTIYVPIICLLNINEFLKIVNLTFCFYFYLFLTLLNHLKNERRPINLTAYHENEMKLSSFHETEPAPVSP